MTKFKKKGFTIVELVIVIAVIAILAAVLIPTFSNIIKRAKISADVQLCRNLNTVLANANAEGRIPGSVYDVLYLENEAGYILENLNPTSEGYYYAWDQKQNKIIYIQEDLQTVYYPEEYTLVPNDCWITVGSADEAKIVASFGYNLALECDIEEEIVLTNIVSINTLGFTAGNVTMSSGDSDVTTAYLIGTFGSTDISANASSIVTSGTISSLDVTGTAATSVSVGGYVSSYAASNSVQSTITSTGLVNTVSNENAGNIINNGVVVNTGNSGENISGTGKTGNTATTGNIVSASTKEDIESIRTQISSGLRNYKGETITLSNDINMNGIAFQPMSNYDRDHKGVDDVKSWFQGTFDGQNYVIQNFSNSGFSITGLNAGTNDSSVPFGESKVVYNEAVYGLFGTVYNATIKNLKVTVNVDMTIDNASKMVGDSVGGIVGFAYGNKVVFENCVVNGIVKGYDGVGAFVGRCYATNLEFIDCTNNAEVISVRKGGGFCGSSSGCTVKYTNCVNNGNITCLGVDKDVELIAWNKEKTERIKNTGAQNGSGYYLATAGTCGGQTAATVIDGFTNNGIIKVGDSEFKGTDNNYYINH